MNAHTATYDLDRITADTMSKINKCKSYDELYDALDDIADSTSEMVESLEDMMKNLVANKNPAEIGEKLTEIVFFQYIAGLNIGITLCADQMLKIKHKIGDEDEQ